MHDCGEWNVNLCTETPSSFAISCSSNLAALPEIDYATIPAAVENDSYKMYCITPDFFIWTARTDLINNKLLLHCGSVFFKL